MIIKVKNTLTDTAPFTFLASSVASGVTVLPWKNASQFTANWAIQLGKTAQEKSEIKVLSSSSPAGTAGTVTANTSFDHPVDTPVYAIHYDQIVFEVSTSGTAGTASPITDGTISIAADNDYTEFDHTSGATTYAYKAYFRNSVSGDISSESDWLTPSGYSFYSLAKIRERIKSKLLSANYIKDDATIDDWTNEWLENMNNTAIDVNQDYSLGTVAIAYGTAGLGTITSTDYKDIRKLEVTSDGNTYTVADRISVIDFNDQQTFSGNFPSYYMYGDTVFGVKPNGAVGTARITYYKLPAVLSNETDELPTSMKGYTKSFVDYGMSQAYYLDGKESAGKTYLESALLEKDRFRTEIGARHKSGVETMKLSDPVSGEDYFEFL